MELERLQFSPKEVVTRVVTSSSVTVSSGIDLIVRVDPRVPAFVIGDPVKYVGYLYYQIIVVLSPTSSSSLSCCRVIIYCV